MKKEDLKVIKTPTLPQHGTFMYGQLDELDFTVAGKGTDNLGKPIAWGHSVKLKFINEVLVEKELQGIKIEQKKTIFELLTITCDSEEEIAQKLAFFEPLKGQEILVPIENNKEKTTYKINDEKLMIIDKKSN